MASLLRLGDALFAGRGVEQDWVRTAAIYYEAYQVGAGPGREARACMRACPPCRRLPRTHWRPRLARVPAKLLFFAARRTAWLAAGGAMHSPSWASAHAACVHVSMLRTVTLRTISMPPAHVELHGA